MRSEKDDIARRVVLTGGPGAGKTLIADAIAATSAGRCVVVPEAATQVYTALGSRWDRLDLAERRGAQRRIYDLQRSQEERFAELHPRAVLLLDRGTLDCAAYWPDGHEAFLADRQTTHEAELARYGHVLWLETAATLGIYDGDGSNACRFEDAEAAVVSGERVRAIWRAHSSFTAIAARRALAEKIAAVAAFLEPLFAAAD